MVTLNCKHAFSMMEKTKKCGNDYKKIQDKKDLEAAARMSKKLTSMFKKGRLTVSSSAPPTTMQISTTTASVSLSSFSDSASSYVSQQPNSELSLNSDDDIDMTLADDEATNVLDTTNPPSPSVMSFEGCIGTDIETGNETAENGES